MLKGSSATEAPNILVSISYDQACYDALYPFSYEYGLPVNEIVKILNPYKDGT